MLGRVLSQEKQAPPFGEGNLPLQQVLQTSGLEQDVHCSTLQLMHV